MLDAKLVTIYLLASLQFVAILALSIHYTTYNPTWRKSITHPLVILIFALFIVIFGLVYYFQPPSYLGNSTVVASIASLVATFLFVAITMIETEELSMLYKTGWLLVLPVVLIVLSFEFGYHIRTYSVSLEGAVEATVKVRQPEDKFVPEKYGFIKRH